MLDTNILSDLIRNPQGKARSSEDARRLALCAAEREGWQFNFKLKRWLCPACVAALREQAV
jgi:hypothetical protein